jgi:peptidoglycan hydrolase CwlO-like protein
MLKKAIVAGGAVALLSSLAVGVPLTSYTRCGVNWLRESASDAMPLEWELKRARQMIGDLKPEISDNAKRIARERIEVARLQEQLETTEQSLAKARGDIERLSGDLEGGDQHFTYAGRTYTSVQVKEDLANRFKRFKTRRATADKLQQMLSARQSALASAEQRMEELLGARRQLEVEVENLQARVAALRVAQTASEFSIDDSQLSHTRQLLDEISTRIQQEEETLAVDEEYFGGINLEDSGDENLLDEIATYFGQPEGETSEEFVAIQLD